VTVREQIAVRRVQHARADAGRTSARADRNADDRGADEIERLRDELGIGIERALRGE
jgi:hypothetical protein